MPATNGQGLKTNDLGYSYQTKSTTTSAPTTFAFAVSLENVWRALGLCSASMQGADSAANDKLGLEAMFRWIERSLSTDLSLRKSLEVL